MRAPDRADPTPAPVPGKLRAVLFDMDGTLTDSERLWTIALEDVARSLGGTLSAAARTAMVGQDVWHSIDLLHADLGVTADPERTAEMLNTATRTVFEAGLPWRPGARALLAAVRTAGLRTALVTATHRPLVDIAMGTLGADNFDVSVAGDEVVANKPDPEPYRRAMDLLRLGPADCLAIEDSPVGSAAALAAGLPVLVVPSEIPVEQTPGMAIRQTLEGVRVGDLVALRARLRSAVPTG